MTPREAVIGVDIGGTKIAAHVCNRDNRTLYEDTCACPAQEGAEAILASVITLCRRLMHAAHDYDIRAIGIGTAGQVNPHTGVIIDANDNLKGWVGTRIAERLHAEFALPIVVDNDVRAMALAECTLGAGRAYQHVLCLTVGTGIGGAIVLDGKLWHGAHFTAGEFGYIRESHHTTIEAVASGVAIEAVYDGGRAYTLQEITQLASNGDRQAQQAIRMSAETLAETLAPIILFLDPQAVILGGGVIAVEPWWTGFTETITTLDFATVKQLPIRRAELGHRAGMVGAALLAWQGVDNT